MFKLFQIIKKFVLRPLVIRFLLVLKFGVLVLWIRQVFNVLAHAQRVIQKIRDHFIPHQGNNYHPRLLKHKALLIYSIILVVIKVLAILLPIALPSSSLLSSALTSQNIITLTNQSRRNIGLADFSINEFLTRAAQAKAQDMLDYQYFGHASPSGILPVDWVIGAGYRYSVMGENLAVHYREAEDVQGGWMASPTHRANILNTNYTEIGVAVIEGEFEGIISTIVVEMFGRPLTVLAPTKLPTKSTSVATIQPLVPSSDGRVAGVITKKTNTANDPDIVLPIPELNNNIALNDSIKNDNVLVQGLPVDTPTVAPIIYDTSLWVQQKKDQYEVQIAVVDAKQVAVQLGDSTIILNQSGIGDVWQGSVPFELSRFNRGGEILSIIATGQNGTLVNRSLRLLSPTNSTSRLYAFTDAPTKIFTFFRYITLEGLEDSVRRFYLQIMVFLSALLLINIFIKIHIQHPSVIVHTTAVIGLAWLLWIV